MSAWIRKSHRWLSLVFMAAVIVNIAATLLNASAVWIGVMALIPLILMMASGLYLFALPYLARRSAGGRENGA